MLELQSSLYRDQLTGLEISRAHILLKELIANPFPVSLIWLDLKGFGRLNTYLGRETGDEIHERLRMCFSLGCKMAII